MEEDNSKKEALLKINEVSSEHINSTKYDNNKRRIIFLLTIFYFFAFAEELPTTAFGVILTNKLNISPAKQTWFYSCAFFAFSMQPLLAIIAQFLSNFITGCRLKFFAIFGAMIGGTMYLLIAINRPSFGYFFIFVIILNLGLSLANAIIDGISVQISNETLHSAASIQSISFFFRSLGSLSSATMLIAVNQLSNYSVIAICGAMYLCLVVPLFCLLFVSRFNDEKVIKTKKCIAMNRELFANIWRPLCFVFVLNAPPTISDALFSFIYSRSHFDLRMLRVFKFMSLCGSVFGSLIFFIFMRKTKTFIFVWMQVLNSLFCLCVIPLTNLANSFVSNPSLHSVCGLPIDLYICIILAMSSLISTLVVMPQLTLAANCSPIRMETAIFSTFIGVSHLGELVSASLSSLLLSALNVKQSHWQNLSKYVYICAILGLLPLFGLCLLSGNKEQTKKKSNEKMVN